MSLLEMDILDLNKLKEYNPFRYALVCVDTYSRYLMAVGLKSKGIDDVIKSFSVLLRGPLTFHCIYSDKVCANCFKFVNML